MSWKKRHSILQLEERANYIILRAPFLLFVSFFPVSFNADLISLQCRRFFSGAQMFLIAKAPCWNFPKRGGNGAYPKGYHFYSPQSSTVIKSKMAATAIYPGYQRFFLACDEEFPWPQADTSSAWPKPETAHEKSLAPRVTAIRTRTSLHCRLRLNKIERLCNLTANRTRWTLQARYLR